MKNRTWRVRSEPVQPAEKDVMSNIPSTVNQAKATDLAESIRGIDGELQQLEHLMQTLPASSRDGLHYDNFALAMIRADASDLAHSRRSVQLQMQHLAEYPQDEHTEADARRLRERLREERRRCCDRSRHSIEVRAGRLRQQRAMLQAKLEQASPADRFQVWVRGRMSSGTGVWEMARWVDSCAPYSQPALSMAASLCCWGALTGRKVQNATGIRPNLYAIGLGPSGCGKDSARQAIKLLMEAAGVDEHHLGSEDLASDSALMAEVAEMPAVLYLLDELGHMLDAQRGTKAAGHAKLIMPTFTRLFSSSKSTMTGKAYADRESRKPLRIHQPCVSLYGTSVAERVWQAMTADDVGDGLLNRFLIWHADPEPAYRDGFGDHDNADLVHRVQAWHNFSAHEAGQEGDGNLAGLLRVRPVVVQATSEAEQLLREFRQEAEKTGRKMSRSADASEARLFPLWVRTHEQACKLALILACADAQVGERLNAERGQVMPAVTGELRIELHHAQDAVHIARELTLQAIEAARHHLMANGIEKDQEAIKAAIKRLGGGATKSELARALRSMDRRVREQRLAELLEQGEVVEQVMPSKGPKPVTVYTFSA